tara:strand:- start:3575 stop:4249 length:675 start_codon:yes stop_codon:yes gene_type:complete
MIKKIYILTGNDEWLTHQLIEKLQPEYRVVLIQIKSNTFKFSKFLKIFILIGLIDLLKILYISSKVKNYEIIKINKNYLGTYLNQIQKHKVFLVNYPFKIKKNYKNIYNCHPSLLPNYKGLLPIQRQIFDSLFNKKKNVFGITIHKLEKDFDTGKIVWNKIIKLDKNEIMNFKKIYEKIYCNFKHGIDQILSPNKKKLVKINRDNKLKSSISFYEIFLLKLNIL